MSTNSELHAMIVNGFASIAGSVLAAFISFGVNLKKTCNSLHFFFSQINLFNILGSTKPPPDCLHHIRACGPCHLQNHVSRDKNFALSQFGNFSQNEEVNFPSSPSELVILPIRWH